MEKAYREKEKTKLKPVRKKTNVQNYAHKHKMLPAKILDGNKCVNIWEKVYVVRQIHGVFFDGFGNRVEHEAN